MVIVFLMIICLATAKSYAEKHFFVFFGGGGGGGGGEGGREEMHSGLAKITTLLNLQSITNGCKLHIEGFLFKYKVKSIHSTLPRLWFSSASA